MTRKTGSMALRRWARRWLRVNGPALMRQQKRKEQQREMAATTRTPNHTTPYEVTP